MIIKRYLLIYALLDFSCQIIAQLPVFSYSVTAKIIGLRKIYTDPHAKIHGAFNYDDLLMQVQTMTASISHGKALPFRFSTAS